MKVDSINNKYDKVIFADQLRVLAFLCVVIVHWIGVYAIHKDVVSDLTFSPPSEIDIEYIYRIITPCISQFNYGPFGVAIFFIISGFVVSFSLKSKERIPFIKARLMRIYPMYIASVFIMIIVLYSTSIFSGRTSQA